MNQPRVRRFPNAGAFLNEAESWLLRAEEENNLLLGIAGSLVRSQASEEPAGTQVPDPAPHGLPAESVYLATIEVEGEIVGCAFRTPPFKLGLTRVPHAAIPALVADVATVFPSIPAVLGPNEQALAFAEAWANEKGLLAEPGARQRIFALKRVVMPDPMAPGYIRPVEKSDLSLVTDWVRDFLESTGLGSHRGAANLAAELVQRSALVLWEDEGPVAMAGYTGRTRNTIRVSYVYTPEAQRRKGYASALVAHLSRFLLDGHAQKCVLYTDLSNPTSNHIYRQIGYRPICDVMDVAFR